MPLFRNFGNKSLRRAVIIRLCHFWIFPLGQDSPAPGARHASIKEAQEEAEEEGTRSILDIEAIGDEPEYGIAAPLPENDLELYFETTKPTRDMVEDNMDFLEDLDRGHCIYIILYRKNKPDEILFAGYSYD